MPTTVFLRNLKEENPFFVSISINTKYCIIITPILLCLCSPLPVTLELCKVTGSKDVKQKVAFSLEFLSECLHIISNWSFCVSVSKWKLLPFTEIWNVGQSSILFSWFLLLGMPRMTAEMEPLGSVAAETVYCLSGLTCPLFAGCSPAAVVISVLHKSQAGRQTLFSRVLAPTPHLPASKESNVNEQTAFYYSLLQTLWVFALTFEKWSERSPLLLFSLLSLLLLLLFSLLWCTVR